MIFVGMLSVHTGNAQTREAQIRQAVNKVSYYDHGKSRADLIAVEKIVHATRDSLALRRVIEMGLVSVLNDTVSLAAKQFAGHWLAVIGSDYSIPALGRLLSSANSDIVQIGCNALRQKNSPAVLAAARSALGRSTGSSLIALIHFVGDLSDSGSTDMLIRLADAKDKAIAEAAIQELGHIVNEASQKTLRMILKTTDESKRLASAGALLTFARQLALKGDRSAAIAIYQELYAGTGKPELPSHIRRGAFLGHLQLAGNDALPLVRKVLHAHDQALEAAAISFVPRIEGVDVTKKLIKELPEISADLQAALIAALSERADGALVPILVKTAQNQAAELKVRMEALKGLASLGNTSHIVLLVQLLDHENKEISRTAESALTIISSPGVDEAILQQLLSAKGKNRSRLITILANRQFRDAVPELLTEAKSDDSEISYAAFRALGMLAMPEDLTHFLDLLLAQSDSRVRSFAESTVGLLARRASVIKGGDEVVYSAMETATTNENKNSLFRVLKIIGDERAFKTVARATLDQDPIARENAVRVLAEWPTSLAEDRLLKIVKNAEIPGHRVLAFRGYLRMLKQSNEPDAQVLDKYVAILAEAKSADEVKLVLSGLARIDRYRALAICAEYLDRSDVNMEACAACIAVARAIIRDMDHIPEIKQTMQKVIATCENQDLIGQAKAVLTSYEPMSEKQIAVNDAPGSWDERWEGYLAYKPHPIQDSTFFNGKNLIGWRDEFHPELWRVNNGIITGHSDTELANNAFLWSTAVVKNFYLSIDVLLKPDVGNAGIQFRSAKKGEEALGYQADVGEAKGEKVWGRLYHEGGREKLDWTNRGDKAVKSGDWNHYEILAIGPYIWTAINNQLVTSVYDPDGETSGLIALQMHYGPPMTVQYRINKLVHNPIISLAGLNENQLFLELVPPGRSAPK